MSTWYDSTCVEVDLEDVARLGSVTKAIAYCAEWQEVAPAIAYSKRPDGGMFQTVQDHTEYLIFYDLMASGLEPEDCRVINPVDGRVCRAKRTFTQGQGPDKTDVVVGIALEWSSSSVVSLACPDLDEAIARPKVFTQMVEDIKDHTTKTDVDAWKALHREVGLLLQSLWLIGDALGRLVYTIE